MTQTLNAGDDVITAGAGNDTIDGGAGTDIAIFSGNYADYSITEISYDNYQIIDARGIDGTDTFTGIETLRFADTDYSIVLAGQNLVGTVSSDTLTGGAGNDSLEGLGGDTLDGSDGTIRSRVEKAMTL